MASQVLYPTAFAHPSGERQNTGRHTSEKLPRPLRVIIISALALASWAPIILLLT